MMKGWTVAENTSCPLKSICLPLAYLVKELSQFNWIRGPQVRTTFTNIHHSQITKLSPIECKQKGHGELWGCVLKGNGHAFHFLYSCLQLVRMWAQRVGRSKVVILGDKEHKQVLRKAKQGTGSF